MHASVYVCIYIYVYDHIGMYVLLLFISVI